MRAKWSLDSRRINDIALSGNGEPTSAREFEQVIELIGNIKHDYDLPAELKLVLITNGSLIDRRGVQLGLRRMSALNGEVWFKLDRATRGGRASINNTRMSLPRMRENSAWLHRFARHGCKPAYSNWMACLRHRRNQTHI